MTMLMPIEAVPSPREEQVPYSDVRAHGDRAVASMGGQGPGQRQGTTTRSRRGQARGRGGQNEAGRPCARPASEIARQSSAEHVATPVSGAPACLGGDAAKRPEVSQARRSASRRTSLGRTISTSKPPPEAREARMEPPCRSTARLAMARPRPTPPLRRSRAASLR